MVADFSLSLDNPRTACNQQAGQKHEAHASQVIISENRANAPDTPGAFPIKLSLD